MAIYRRLISMYASGSRLEDRNWRVRHLTHAQHFHNLRNMETSNIIESFSALAQETRLEVFRLLVRQEPDGLPAGEIARQLSVPHATMSAHLAVLSRASLVVSRRQGRSIIYRANLSHMQEAIRFLVRDCCAGHPEVCEPLSQSLLDCPPNQDEK